MARGNQRDKAREKNQAKLAAQVRMVLCARRHSTPLQKTNLDLQKSGNNMTGSELQKAKESAAEIMRKKQAAGKYTYVTLLHVWKIS